MIYSRKKSKASFFKDVYQINGTLPRLNLHLHVLIHELYPKKDLSSPCPGNRDDRLSPLDFVHALQKMDLDGLWIHDLDEANFAFQANQFPLSCFTSSPTDCRSKPGPSTEYSAAEFTEPQLPLDSPFSPLLPLTPFSNDVKAGGCDNPASVSPCPDSFSKSDRSEIPELCDQLTSPTTGLISPHVSPFDDVTFGRSSCSSKALRATACESDSETTEISVDSCLVTAKSVPSIPSSPSFWRSPPDRVDRFTNERSRYNVDDCLTLSDEHQPENDFPDLCYRSFPSNSRRNPVSNELTAPPKPSHFRKTIHFRRSSNLKPCNVDHRNANGISGGSNSVQSIFGPTVSSSDSELDYRSVNPGYSHSQSDGNGMSPSGSTSTHAPSGYQELNDTLDESVVSHLSSPSISHFTGSPRKSDRQLHDKDAVIRAKIPFSYDEIVHSTNDRFRELKSAPYLTEQQVIIMMNARKRATNRLAAERSRRSKALTRDVLSDQLISVRRERQVLQRQVAHARQRKRDANDALLAEQKRVLSLLCGPDGDQLRYSDWRVRLTNEDEVVVVAVGQ